MAEHSAVQLERRRINDEIESSYIMTVQAASNIHVALATGKGNYMTKFTDFYQWSTHLITLTCDLPAMVEGENDLCVKSNLWISNQEGLSEGHDDDLKIRCRFGVELFREYKKALMKRGIIALPTKKG